MQIHFKVVDVEKKPTQFLVCFSYTLRLLSVAKRLGYAVYLLQIFTLKSTRVTQKQKTNRKFARLVVSCRVF